MAFMGHDAKIHFLGPEEIHVHIGVVMDGYDLSQDRYQLQLLDPPGYQIMKATYNGGVVRRNWDDEVGARGISLEVSLRPWQSVPWPYPPGD